MVVLSTLHYLRLTQRTSPIRPLLVARSSPGRPLCQTPATALNYSVPSSLCVLSLRVHRTADCLQYSSHYPLYTAVVLLNTLPW